MLRQSDGTRKRISPTSRSGLIDDHLPAAAAQLDELRDQARDGSTPGWRR